MADSRQILRNLVKGVKIAVFGLFGFLCFESGPRGPPSSDSTETSSSGLIEWPKNASHIYFCCTIPYKSTEHGLIYSLVIVVDARE